jgi:hypothetical protein
MISDEWKKILKYKKVALTKNETTHTVSLSLKEGVNKFRMEPVLRKSGKSSCTFVSVGFSIVRNEA